MRGQVVEQGELTSRHADRGLIDVHHAAARIDAQATDLDIAQVGSGSGLRRKRARVEDHDVVVHCLDRQPPRGIGMITHIDAISRTAQDPHEPGNLLTRATPEHEHARVIAPDRHGSPRIPCAHLPRGGARPSWHSRPTLAPPSTRMRGDDPARAPGPRAPPRRRPPGRGHRAGCCASPPQGRPRRRTDCHQ